MTASRAYVVITAGQATRLEAVETRSKLLTQLELAPVIRDHAIAAHTYGATVIVVVCTKANAADPWFWHVCRRAFDPRCSLYVIGREPDGSGPAISAGLRVAQDAECTEALVAHADTVVSPDDVARIVQAHGIGVGIGAMHPSTVWQAGVTSSAGSWRDGVEVSSDDAVYMGMAWTSLTSFIPVYNGVASFLNDLTLRAHASGSLPLRDTVLLQVFTPSWRDVGDVAAIRAEYIVPCRDGQSIVFRGDTVFKANAGRDLARLPAQHRPAIIDDHTIERLSMRTVADMWLLEPRFNLQRATEDVIVALQRLHATPPNEDAQAASSIDVAAYQYARIKERAQTVRDEDGERGGRFTASSRFASRTWRNVYLTMVDEVFDGYLGEYQPALPVCNTHGDPNFGNVFYDTRLGAVKFIDPRDAARAIGDPEYDIAKVYYSVWLDFCAISLGMPWHHRSAKDVQIVEDVITSAGAGYSLQRVKHLAILLSLAGIPVHAPGESDLLVRRVHEAWRTLT